MKREESSFDYVLVVCIVVDPDEANLVKHYYGVPWGVVEDDAVDLAREEDVLAQVGFYEDVKKDHVVLKFSAHFVKLTYAAFAQTQKDARCFVHVCTEHPEPQAYRSQRKALRKERGKRAQKRLKYEEDKKDISEEF